MGMHSCFYMLRMKSEAIHHCYAWCNKGKGCGYLLLCILIKVALLAADDRPPLDAGVHNSRLTSISASSVINIFTFTAVLAHGFMYLLMMMVVTTIDRYLRLYVLCLI